MQKLMKLYIEGYTPVGVNPFIRFHEQKDGNNLQPHYDTDLAYQFNNKYRTIRAFTIYLTDNQSGAIRFIENNILDDESNLYMNLDYIGSSKTTQVFPSMGKILIFDSRLLHCVTNIIGEVRKTLVSEIVYIKNDA